MPRPVKRGLSYYSRPVDYYFDYKIMNLLGEYGPVGVTIYDVIVGMVYSESYYLAVPLDELILQLIRIIGNRWIKEKDFVKRVILYCGHIGLFDDDLLRQGVITSAEIQEYYAEVTVRSKADRSKYWLLGKDWQPSGRMHRKAESTEESGVFAVKTPESHENIPQKKIEENKREDMLSSNNNNNGLQELSPFGNDRIYDGCSAVLCGAAQEAFSRIKDLTNAERLQLDSLCRRYGEELVLLAIEDARQKGGHAVSYLVPILRDMQASLDDAEAAQWHHQSPPVRWDTAPVANSICPSERSQSDVDAVLDADWLSETM